MTYYPNHELPQSITDPKVNQLTRNANRAKDCKAMVSNGPATIGLINREGYFTDIYQMFKSILIGMRITAKYWFSPTVTIQYPFEKIAFAPRYRGIHEFESEKCIACDMCAKACPVDCIYIDKSAPRKMDKKTGIAAGGELLRYAIDYQKCMFCGLCTEPCPTDCIHMGKNHDLSSYSRDEMIVEFAEIANQGLRTPMPLWAERNAAKIPWANSEKERILRGEIATTEADISEL